MNLDNLENQLDQLGQTVATGPSLVSAVMARVEGLPMQSARPLQLRRWIMRSTIGLAAGVAAALFLINVLTRPVVAFADVVNKIQQTRTLSWFDDSAVVTMHFYMKGEFIRMEMSGSSKQPIVDIWNRTTGKMLVLDRNAKQAITMVQAQRSYDIFFDLYTLLKDFKDGKEESLGEKKLNGHAYAVFRITRPFFGINQMKATELTLWVDSATDLPVQVDYQIAGRSESLKNLKFDADLPDSLFDMTAPAGYTRLGIDGIRSDQLKPAPTAQEAADTLTLRPGIGIGSLKFGSSKAEVVKYLGKPEQVMGDENLLYFSKGIIMMVATEQGLLRVVAVSGKSASPFAANDFPGKTDKGIGIGSSHAQIEAAYGIPTTVEIAPGKAYLTYTNRNILLFTLYSDKVAEISIGKPMK